VKRQFNNERDHQQQAHPGRARRQRSHGKDGDVVVERRVKHAIYDKIMMRSSKYHAHDDNNEAKAGDLVEIQECRPLSKSKSWVVTKLLERAVAI
jgi:small subunit ribosomal protein S17